MRESRVQVALAAMLLFCVLVKIRKKQVILCSFHENFAKKRECKFSKIPQCDRLRESNESDLLVSFTWPVQGRNWYPKWLTVLEKIRKHPAFVNWSNNF